MLIVNNQEITSDSEKMEVLCNHFTRSFNNSLPPLSPDDVQSIEIDPSACPEHLLCTEEEVFSLLTLLDVTKASGPDGISAHMLKATAATIAPVVTKLFNLSISTGSFPWTAKSSLVVPVPKSTDHTSPSNYRPISLLAILSKVLEKYICSLVTDELHLSSHSAFHQWGFRLGHSTSSALTTVVDDWLKSMEHGKPVCSVFFDVRKAFDSVPHSSLVHKLQTYGLNTYLLRWICDYLSGREQRVVLNGTTSMPQHALSWSTSCRGQF